MQRHLVSVPLLAGIAVLATVIVRQAWGQADDSGVSGLKQPTKVIDLPRQTLTFRPTREDITVGCVIFSLHHANTRRALPLEAIRVNGAPPKTATLYLKKVGKNKFELPAVKIEFSSQQLGGPLYLTVKVWFNELTNQHDSPYYRHVPDRYALVSYCTKEDEDPSKVNGRLGANRVASLAAFKDRLGKPFVIELKQRPLREELGRWPMINNAGRRLKDADLKAIEQLVRDRGERYLITISANGRDRGVVHVGDTNVFEGKRVYQLTRTDMTWRIEKVINRKSGW